MKNILFLCATLWAGTLLAQDKDTPYQTKTLHNEQIRAVDLQTSGGSLTVEGVNDAEARLEVFVRPNNGNNKLSKQEIDELLKESHDLEITVSNGQLKAVSKTKKNVRNSKISVSFKAYVPKAAAASLNTSGGSLSVNGIAGKVNGTTSGGSIRISNLNNDIDLKTSGGSITASNTTGSLNLMTSGGSIKLNNLKGSIRAHTSGGSIKGEEIKGELIAKTSGGSISIDRMSGSVELATSAGSTHLQMLEIDKYVKVDVSAGSVDLQLPLNKGLDLNLAANRISVPLNNFSGVNEKDKIVGKINGGGASVRVSASAGNLKISDL